MNTIKKGSLFFLVGKMGAGKSTYASSYAAEVGAVLISEDEWLSALFPDEITTFDDFVVRHKRLLKVLGTHLVQLLKAGTHVVLDFPANTIKERKWYASVAQSADAQCEAFYLNVSDEVCLQQIAKRREEQPDRAKFDTADMFHQVTAFFQAPSENEGFVIKVID